MAQNAIVNQGLTQVFTGLGILLGAGRISTTTHEKILSLINADQGPATIDSGRVDAKEAPNSLPRPGKDTPVSIQSHDLIGLGGELADLAITTKSPRGPVGNPPHKHAVSSWHPAPSDTPKSGNMPKIICPWWSTDGYNCREHEKGRCPMIHEDIADGLRDPLICHFWADGGRCTKSEASCRFAHYPAQHRLIAPMPAKKKSKKPRAVAEANHEGWSNTSRPAHSVAANDDDYWGGNSRAQANNEW
ncbi:hypothetical protein F4677DRAFT_261531 [Hypoxylon crocopeplum]|nr:hypothetical protein F4677DRAFT_261531 [Hypoxylon crocopeplum]